MNLIALRKFSGPEGKFYPGEEFETDRPEFFLSRGYAYESGQTEAPADDSGEELDSGFSGPADA